MVALNLEQLRTLVAVVDHGTFDAAALALNVSAPAISQRIRALEDAAGRVLVRRDKPVLPTPAGEALLRTARQMLHLEHVLELELSPGGPEAPGEDTEAASETEGNLATLSLPIAVNSDSLAAWFLRALIAAECGPHIVFDIRREDEARSTNLLRSGEVMAAVTSVRTPVQGCRVVPLGTMRYRACVSVELAQRHGLRAEAGIAEQRIVLREMPYLNYDANDEMQSRYYQRLTGEAPGPLAHSIPSTNEYHEAILLGLGWGLLPEQIAEPDLARGALMEIAPRFRHEVPLYWQHWKIRSSVLDRITLAVRETAQSVLG